MLVSAHGTRERFWVQLVHALYLSGRQADALGAYQRARTVLVDELGLDPGAELRTIHAAVLAQDPALDIIRPANRQPVPAGLALAGTPFVGRADDLSWLRQRWAETVAGHGSVVVVTGPEGAGKSRLLAELGMEVHQRGGVVSYDIGTRAPNPSALVAAACGRPALALLDEPVTAVAATAVAGMPLLVVAALDTSHAARHVRAGFLGSEQRELPPLSDEAGLRIIDLYLDSNRAAIDVDHILRASAGRPGLLHELAAAQVERSAIARIGSAAQLASSARTNLTVVRRDLKDGLLDLHRGRAQRSANDAVRARSTGTGPLSGCPYKGLSRFERGDSALFHGRDDLVSTLLARIADSRLVAIIGASGAGKSSLVRAGLLACLADGSLPGSGAWAQHLMTPGEAIPALEGGEGVLVVDQFEEVWTALDADRRGDFVDGVVAAAHSGWRVVITLRADYVDRCAEHVTLGSLVSEGTVLVGPMTDHEVRRAVEGPAEVAGLVVDPRLVEQVVKDVRAQPGALPLMSAALADTWEGRSGHRLTIAAYTRAGGVSGAVARMAEDTYGALSPSEQSAVRRLFLRLARSGDEGGLLRRRVPLPELDQDADTARSLESMTRKRLLSIDQGSVEVSHEALFLAWPRLAEWLTDDEQGRLLRKHLAPAALEWEAGQRSATDLYRGVRLEAVLEWTREHRTDLTHLEREFVDASVAEVERELSEQRKRAEREARGRKRLRVLSALIAVTLAVAIVAAVIAISQRRQVEDVARRAVARQLGSAALVEEKLDRSLLLAAAAVGVDDSSQTRGDLLAALQRSPAALRVLRGNGNRLLALDVSTDGIVVAGDNDGNVSTWDADSGRAAGPRVRASDFGYVDIAARPGSGEVILSSLRKGGPQLPRLIRWDVARQEQIGPRLPGASSPMGSLSWTPDGRWLAASQDAGDVLVWDFEHLDRPPAHLETDHERFLNVAYAGGRRFILVPVTGKASVWLPGATKPLRRFDVGSDVTAAVSNPTGSLLAVGHEDGATALWETDTGALRARLTSHGAEVGAAAFDRQSSTVATMGNEGDVILSDVASGEVLETLTGHSGEIAAGAFSPDGRTLYTAASDASVIAWDVTGERRLGAIFPDSRGVDATWATVGDAGVVAVTHADGTVRFWDADSGQPRGDAVQGDQKAILAASFSPDGSELATAALGGTVQLWDTATSAPGALIRGLPGDANEVAFSPDGRLLAVCVWEPGGGTIHLFDTVTHKQVGAPIDVGWGIPQLAWSPDSMRLAVSSWEENELRVYDVPSHGLVWRQKPGDIPEAVAWSPDGARVATGDDSGNVRLWDAVTGRPVGEPFGGHTAPIVTTSYSPDGELLASAGYDGRVILRDAVTGEQLGTPLDASPSRYTFARFDAQGRLFVGSDDGAMWRWDVDADSWRRRACAIAGRDLTQAEWADLNTGWPYQAACS